MLGVLPGAPALLATAAGAVPAIIGAICALSSSSPVTSKMWHSPSALITTIEFFPQFLMSPIATAVIWD